MRKLILSLALIGAAFAQAPITNIYPGGSGSGTVTSSGSPLIHQVPLFTTGTDIKGLAVGATNAVLHGNTGADPSFSAVADGDLTGQVGAPHGGTGVNNTATLTLGSSDVNLATLGTGIVKNTNTTGALTDAAASDVIALWTTCTSGWLKWDGTCTTPGGGGTVTSSGSPAIHQISVFTTGTDIKGITVPAAGTMLQGSAAADPSWTATPTLGVASTTTGTLTFAGAGGSGGITLSPPTSGALGTTAVKIPPTAGTLVTTGTTPITVDATTGAAACATCVVMTTPVAVAATATASTIAERNASGEVIAANTVATGLTPTYTVASGTLALATSSISSGACQTVTQGSVNSVAATGAATTDTVGFTPNGSIKAVTGYVPATTGGLTIAAYPTSGYVNFDVCNWTSGAVTPGAVTLNYRVTR